MGARCRQMSGHDWRESRVETAELCAKQRMLRGMVVCVELGRVCLRLDPRVVLLEHEHRAPRYT